MDLCARSFLFPCRVKMRYSLTSAPSAIAFSCADRVVVEGEGAEVEEEFGDRANEGLRRSRARNFDGSMSSPHINTLFGEKYVQNTILSHALADLKD